MEPMTAKPAARMRTHEESLVRHAAAVFALSGLLALPGIAQQSSTPDSGGGQPSSSSQTKQQNQKTPPAQKSAAQENPFPGDVSKQAAQQQSQPADAPAAPDTSQPDTGQPDAGQQPPQATPQPAQKPGNAAAQENPFPEDVSKSAAAAAAKNNDAAGSSSSSSSSSNPAGDASGADTDPNADLPRNTSRRRLKKPSENDIQSGSLAGEGKAGDDVRVGRFYLNDGNYKGAYGRFSEASRLDPTNADAIYGLAAAAAGLHQTDEALTNYKLYLQIAPDGNNVKSARKAIRALSK
jgi:tetratricopeptide (TPR) repeat protein